MFSNHEMCEITVPVNHYDVITFHWKSSANPRWNYTGNGRILRGSAAIRGGIKIFRGGIISGQVSGIAGGSEKSSAGMGGLVKIPLDCTVKMSGSAKVIQGSSFYQIMMGWSHRCYIPIFVKIGLPALVKKIF